MPEIFSAEGTTESVTPSGFWFVVATIQGFRATHFTACLCSVALSVLFVKGQMSRGPFLCFFRLAAEFWNKTVMDLRTVRKFSLSQMTKAKLAWALAWRENEEWNSKLAFRHRQEGQHARSIDRSRHKRCFYGFFQKYSWNSFPASLWKRQSRAREIRVRKKING